MFVTRLYRVLELLLLLAVGATALAYPLCLPEARLQAIYDSMDSRVFQQVLPWISCGFSPLVLKEAVLLTLAFAALFVFLWIKVYEQWTGRVSSTPEVRNQGGVFWRNPMVWLLAWVVYSGVSIAWSPIFQHSLEVWVHMTAGIGVAVLALSVPSRRSFAIRFMALVVVCGVVLAGIALLQHLQKAWWLPSSLDPRNRMSSLIGHNTGLSAWLMFPLAYGIYFGVVNRRRLVRGLAWASVVLFVVVIVAAQSRAIWVLGLVIVLLLPWRMMRLMGRRVTLGKVCFAAVAAVVVVMVLVASPQKNPLARLPVSLGERLTGHVFNLDQLRRETRLRILVVSLSEIVPKHAVLGTGIGSFEWVYPKAQGDYFLKHPETRLGTTTKRTDLAHNDYLQALVETGLVGVVLLGGCVLFFWGGVLRSRGRIERGENVALWWALIVPVAGVVVHATVDFPLHVAPLAVVTLISAVMCRKVASFEGGEVVVAVEDLAEGDVAEGGGQVAGGRFVPVGASLIITMVIFSWSPWAFSALVGRPLVSDTYFNAGRAMLDQFYESRGQTASHRFSLLERARRYFREAVVNNVFNGEAYEGQATAYVNRASLALQHYELAVQDDATSAVAMLRAQIERDSLAAISVIDNQMASGGLRYHFTYYLLGRAWRVQWELEKDEVAAEDSRAYKEAIAALRTAVEFNSADANSLRELSDMLAQSSRTVRESHETLSRLFDIDPYSARELVVLPAIELAEEGDILAAEASLESLFDSHPEVPAAHAARAWLAFYRAVWPPREIDGVDREEEYLGWRREHLDGGLASVEALPDTPPYDEDKRRLKLLYAAAAGDLDRADRLARARIEEDPEDPEALVIQAWVHRERFGGGVPARESLDYLRLAAVYSVYFMGPRQQGLVWAGELNAKGGKLTIGQARRLASFCVANDLWSVLARALPGIREDYPGDPVLEDIAVELERAVE